MSAREAIQQQQSSRFESVVLRAVPVWKAMTAGSPKFDTHHASVPRNRKLTAAAFLREALKNGNTTVVKVRKLSKRLAAAPDHPTIDTFLAAVVRGCVATRTDEGALFHAPPAGHLVGLLPLQDHQQFLNLLMEAQVAGTNVLELVAAGVQRAIDTAPPDVWGTAESLDEERLKAEERAALWAALKKELRAAATAEDMRLDWVEESKSLALITYKWRGAPTTVGVGEPDALDQLCALATAT